MQIVLLYSISLSIFKSLKNFLFKINPKDSFAVVDEVVANEDEDRLNVLFVLDFVARQFLTVAENSKIHISIRFFPLL